MDVLASFELWAQIPSHYSGHMLILGFVTPSVADMEGTAGTANNSYIPSARSEGGGVCESSGGVAPAVSPSKPLTQKGPLSLPINLHLLTGRCSLGLPQYTATPLPQQCSSLQSALQALRLAHR